MEEVAQVRAVHPQLDPPRRAALRRAERPRPAALHRGHALLRRPGLAELPRRRAAHLGDPRENRDLAAAFAAAAAAAAAPAAALDLTGTWHVLVHYKDKVAHNADAERWEDRVWVFEREGDRLRWVDYPLVVLSDETGRFERLGTNRASRILAYWTPNPAQQAQIERGPPVNSRGSKSKTLTGTEPGLGLRQRAPASRPASSPTRRPGIDGLPDKPGFSRPDSLGRAAARRPRAARSSRRRAEAGGDVLRGKYDRDGKRIGTFVIARVGAVHSVSEGGGKSAVGGQDEARRVHRHARAGPRRSPAGRAHGGPVARGRHLVERDAVQRAPRRFARARSSERPAHAASREPRTGAAAVTTDALATRARARAARSRELELSSTSREPRGDRPGARRREGRQAHARWSRARRAAARARRVSPRSGPAPRPPPRAGASASRPRRARPGRLRDHLAALARDPDARAARRRGGRPADRLRAASLVRRAGPFAETARGEIEALFVREDARRAGAGRASPSGALAWLAERGRGRVAVHVDRATPGVSASGGRSASPTRWTSSSGLCNVCARRHVRRAAGERTMSAPDASSSRSRAS